jgi:peptidoglycan/xylan/chitin deacetylase (PgdA/CDA1 family)
MSGGGTAPAPTLALTFDDGPNCDGTPAMLALLEAHAVSATFFVWGEQAQRHPDLVQAVAAAGHSVQPHCWAHVSHWTLEPAAIREDIDRVISLLGELGIAAPALWRPPYGRTLRGATDAIAAECGLELAGWTLDPEDWAGADAATMHAATLAAAASVERAVLLLHDGHREPGPRVRRADIANTVELVRMLLEDSAFEFAPLSSGLTEGLSPGP